MDNLTAWQPFYSVLAGASATFAGLLFVSVTLKLDVLMQPEGEALRRLARHTFGCFIYLVIFSLIVLIPSPSAAGISVPLLIVGAMALLQVIVNMRKARAAGEHATAIGELPLYWLSLVTYAVLLLVAVLVWRGRTEALFLLVTVMLWQLAWATRLAWDLLMLVHRVK